MRRGWLCVGVHGCALESLALTFIRHQKMQKAHEYQIVFNSPAHALGATEVLHSVSEKHHVIHVWVAIKGLHKLIKQEC